VMREPDAADREEAPRVGQIGRPLLGDALPEVLEPGLRDADLEDEKGDRDCEDAVAERLDAARVPAVAPTSAAIVGPMASRAGPSGSRA
jgi:hypothetical protein